jgi:dihydrofolate synthase/folylpolyglutamate synthase
MNTYSDTLDWMYARLPMYQQKGADALQYKLATIRKFAAYLGDPHQQFKSIHVAGTNGKGSSCHMLAAVLQEAGYTVGLYTSPHLKEFTERIRINGEPIPQEQVVEFAETNKSYLEEHPLSFFEMTVGMAFDYFAEQRVDIAVIEVGLGGRLDSTNIISPEICLITNIGMDHQQILGNTLAKIGLEKAGIIKPNTPVVIGQQQPEVEGVFRMIAARKESEITFADPELGKTYKTDLLGKYQKKNIPGVVETLRQLSGFIIKEKHIKAGLQKVVELTGLLGRWQLLQEEPKVICDTGHNIDGIQTLMKQLKKQKYNKLHLVWGMVRDKSLDEILPLLPQEATYYYVQPQIQRALEAKALANAGKKHGLRGQVYPNVAEGYAAALATAKPEDLVFIGGSTFVVAEVL